MTHVEYIGYATTSQLCTSNLEQHRDANSENTSHISKWDNTTREEFVAISSKCFKEIFYLFSKFKKKNAKITLNFINVN